jgi:hypothetical protein
MKTWPPFTLMLLLAATDAEVGRRILGGRDTTSQDIAHLTRWAKRDPAAQIYRKLNEVDEALFISLNLWIRILAERADQATVEMAALTKQAKKVLPRARKLFAIARANFKMSEREFEALIAECREIETGLDTWLAEAFGPVQAIVRSDENGSRKRTIFCRLLSNKIHSMTGRWHTREVAELCEIAFDCGDVTDEMVRAARRDFTRKKR